MNEVHVELNSTEITEIIRALDFQSDYFDERGDAHRSAYLEELANKLRIYRDMMR